MSWLRTMLLATLVALLFARSATLTVPTSASVLPAVTAVAGWAVIVLVGRRRAAAMVAPVPPPVRWAAPLTAFVAAGYAVAGVALVLMG